MDSDEVKILRGLFYVHLYGAFEKSVNDIIQSYLRKVETLGVVKAHAVPQFWPTALDASFKSLQSTQGVGNWKKRAEFISSIDDVPPPSVAGLFRVRVSS